MKKIFFYISILFTFLYSQTDKQKVGIYFNLNELKTNSPSMFINKKDTDSKENWRLLVFNKKNNIWYYDHQSKDFLKCKEKKVFGFFDGKNFYIKYLKNFYKLEIMPRYSMFSKNKIDNIKKNNSNEEPVLETNSDEVAQLYILNMNTGAIDVLNASILEEILSDDPDLKYDFISNKSRTDLFSAYLSQFNKRNFE